MDPDRTGPGGGGVAGRSSSVQRMTRRGSNMSFQSYVSDVEMANDEVRVFRAPWASIGGN